MWFQRAVNAADETPVIAPTRTPEATYAMRARGGSVTTEPAAGRPRSIAFSCKGRWGDVVALAFILGCAARLTHNIDIILDIDLSDSTRYLIQGVRLREAGLPPAEWSPIYALWYYLLSLFQRDNIRLYYLNYVLLTSLTPLLLYVYLRRISVGPLIALCAASAYLLSHANVAALPYVTKFAALLLLLSLTATTYLPRHWRYTSLIVGVLAVSFVRPELFLSFLLFGAVAVVALLWRSRRHQGPSLRSRLPQVSVVVLATVVFVGGMGSPIGGERLLLAFRQHFSRNYVRWSHSDIDPWRQYGPITETVFGDFDSIPQAASHNPYHFLRHVASNASRLPTIVAKTVLVHLTDKTAPAGSAALVRTGELVILFLAILLAIPLDWLPVRTTGRGMPGADGLPSDRGSRGLLDFAQGAAGELSVLLLLLLPVLALTSLVIYPRCHCLQVPVVLLLLLIATAASYRLSARFPSLATRINGPIHVIWLGVFVLACTPSPTSGWSPFQITAPHRVGYAGTDVKATLLFLRRLNIEKDVSLLWSVSLPERQTVYLGDGFESVDPDTKNMPFDRFMVERDIDLIVWPWKLARHERFGNDPEYWSFLLEASEVGRGAVTVPGTQGRRRVILRQGIS
jgi:hypothetical protein